MKTFLFVARIAFAWSALFVLGLIAWSMVSDRSPSDAFGMLFMLLILGVAVRAFSHVRRVRLIANQIDAGTLASRHRRRIELPFPAEPAFALVDAAIRELPHVEHVDSARDSLQVRARVRRTDPYGHRPAPGTGRATRRRANQVFATVEPGESTSSVTLICEPEGGAWVDWLFVDDGTNLDNVEAITRAITRRVGEQRKGEEAHARETATGRELAVAKLNLLHAQVEPHFLYNTLANAQVLTRSDPAGAERMLGHLIVYLRHSLPRAGEEMSTLGVELERARAYLEILRIRMGERLALQIQVPGVLESLPLPAMMLQTLVENAIKHGLEPQTAGGTVWIIAREEGPRVAVTVADDGRGFSEDGGGTGIGLRNVRERLRLVYGDAASFSIGSNFPRGVAATVSVPATGPRAADA